MEDQQCVISTITVCTLKEVYVWRDRPFGSQRVGEVCSTLLKYDLVVEPERKLLHVPVGEIIIEFTLVQYCKCQKVTIASFLLRYMSIAIHPVSPAMKLHSNRVSKEALPMKTNGTPRDSTIYTITKQIKAFYSVIHILLYTHSHSPLDSIVVECLVAEELDFLIVIFVVPVS